MKRFFLSITTLFTFLTLSAQLSVSNHGALISLKNGAFISVHGDYLSQNNGSFDNEDTVFLYGDWINEAGNTGFNEPMEGTVVLIGDSQRVRGTDITHYTNFDLRGTGVKFGDIDVIVDSVLQLNDREFNMDTNTVEVTHPDTGSVKRSTGFVSSLKNGGIARHTNTTADYLFPVGSGLGTLRYRPVDITPGSVSPHIFKVRMANIDATTEGFDRGVREPVICEINPYFYHRIFRMAGSDPADIKMHYDEAQDGQYKNMVHWQNIPQWEDMTPATYLPGGGGLFSTVEVTNWNDFTYSPFALANTSQRFDINNDSEIICEGDTVVLSVDEDFITYEFFVNGEPVQVGPNGELIISNLGDGDSIFVVAQDTTCIAYSNPLTVDIHDNPTPYAGEDTTVFVGADVQLEGSGGIDYIWTPDSSLSCSNCQNPLATVYETTPYVLTAFNELGCKASDTIIVIVDEEIDPRDVLFIPNAITPNGDGVNDEWNIRNLELFQHHEVVILNRWGDVLYSSSPYVDSWDGTYKGKPVPDGTYYYILKLPSVDQVLNGPLTIVR